MDRGTEGYGRYTELRWRHPRNVPPCYFVGGDNVSVYTMQYETFVFNALDKAYRCVVP